MNENQMLIVQANMRELCDTIKYNLQPFRLHLQLNNIINFEEWELTQKEVLSATRVIRLLENIKRKDHGWTALITYLYEYGSTMFAARLQRAAMEPVTMPILTSSRPSQLPVFIRRLKEYYKTTYAEVPSFAGRPFHVSNIWVPLQMADISEKSRGHFSVQFFDHMQLLEKLYSRTTDVASVQGQAGSGKTTLVKKIAYDWANDQLSTSADSGQFDIVLAVRASPDIDVDFLRLGVRHMAAQLSLSAGCPIDAVTVIKEMQTYHLKVLVCIDGFSAKRHLSSSMDEAAFISRPILESTYGALAGLVVKLLVTTRKHDEMIKTHNDPNISAVQLEIWQLDDRTLRELIRLCCPSYHEEQQVLQVLRADSKKMTCYNSLSAVLLCYMVRESEEVRRTLVILLDAVSRFLAQTDPPMQDIRKRQADAHSGQLARMLLVDTNFFQFADDGLWQSTDCILSAGRSAGHVVVLHSPSARLTDTMTTIIVPPKALPLFASNWRRLLSRPITIVCESHQFQVVSAEGPTICQETPNHSPFGPHLMASGSKAKNRIDVNSDSRPASTGAKTTNVYSVNSAPNIAGLNRTKQKRQKEKAKRKAGSLWDKAVKGFVKVQSENPMGICPNSPFGTCAICTYNRSRLIYEVGSGLWNFVFQ